jgi:hypothetical protein
MSGANASRTTGGAGKMLPQNRPREQHDTAAAQANRTMLQPQDFLKTLISMITGSRGSRSISSGVVVSDFCIVIH